MTQFAGGSSKEEVKELEQFERKRAAIETLFTLALLYVAALQVWTNVYQRLNLYAILPIVVLLFIALLLGGGNLWVQIRNGLRKHRNRINNWMGNRWKLIKKRLGVSE